MKELFVVAALLAIPARAAAAAADGGAHEVEDVEELAASIARDAQALSTDDCASACKALASMLRAADRICALDPGRRCEDARATVEDATRKVRAACPQCAIAPGHERRDGKIGSAPVAASAPPSERRTGGCAGCATSGGGGSAAGGALAVALGLTALVRRRRRSAHVRVRAPLAQEPASPLRAFARPAEVSS